MVFPMRYVQICGLVPTKLLLYSQITGSTNNLMMVHL